MHDLLARRTYAGRVRGHHRLQKKAHATAHRLVRRVQQHKIASRGEVTQRCK
jgi:hypothetical protein